MDPKEKEIFVPMIGLNGYYEVSNKGRIFSVDRAIVYKNGIIHKHKRREVLGSMDKDGYKVFSSSVNRNIKCIKFHRAVLSSFMGFDNQKRECNHINGVKSDNRLCNLEWVTSSENKLHAHRIGLKRKKQNTLKFKRGTDHYMSKILIMYNKDFDEIKRFSPMKECEKEGISLGCVSKMIKNGWTYKGFYFKKISKYEEHGI